MQHTLTYLAPRTSAYALYKYHISEGGGKATATQMPMLRRQRTYAFVNAIFAGETSRENDHKRSTIAKEATMHKLQKSARTQLRVEVNDVDGRRMVDVRLWAKAKDGDYIPTRRGVSIWPEQVGALVALLKDVDPKAHMDTLDA